MEERRCTLLATRHTLRMLGSGAAARVACERFGGDQARLCMF